MTLGMLKLTSLMLPDVLGSSTPTCNLFLLPSELFFVTPWSRYRATVTRGVRSRFESDGTKRGFRASSTFCWLEYRICQGAHSHQGDGVDKDMLVQGRSTVQREVGGSPSLRVADQSRAQGGAVDDARRKWFSIDVKEEEYTG